MGNLANLARELYLDKNGLSGEIPTELGKGSPTWKDLSYLGLNG